MNTTIKANNKRSSSYTLGKQAHPSTWAYAARTAAHLTAGRRRLNVEAQRTKEIAPREFVRVAVTLSAYFPASGDRAAQLTGLVAQANTVADWEIARLGTKKSERSSDTLTPVYFAPEATGRTVGVTYGGTFKAVKGDENCFAFFRVDAGCEEPIDDGADPSDVFAELGAWLSVHLRAQIEVHRANYARAQQAR
jgi:hypothetical protein